MFSCKFDLPQVKQNLISSVANFICKLPHEFLHDVILRILGNKKIISKLGGNRLFSSFPSKIEFLAMQSKLSQKQISKFSGLDQFYLIFLLSSKSFITGCLTNQIFALNSSESPLNLNILTFLLTSKALSGFS